MKRLKTSLYLAALIFFPISDGGSSAATPEYVLERGDVIELSVVGATDLRYRATLGPDGYVDLPLAGQLKAAGMALPELQAKVRGLIATKPYRMRTQDGRDVLVMVTPEQVMLAISEFRPVYLNGDVAKPGEQTFRPGMTVRQAVALAGGYDLVRFRMNNPVLETADLRAEYDALWIQFATQQEYVQQFRDALGDGKATLASDNVKTPVRAETAQRIANLANKELELRSSAYQRERALYLEAIKNEERRIAVLADQSRKEQEGANNDANELKRLYEAEKRGIISPARMADIRRSALGSESRGLQARAHQIEAERTRDDWTMKLHQLDSKQRIALAEGLQSGTLALEVTRTKLQAVSEKLAYSGMIRSQLSRGSFSMPEVKIVRSSGPHSEIVPASEEDELRPGDVVEISLRGLAPPPSATADNSSATPDKAKVSSNMSDKPQGER